MAPIPVEIYPPGGLIADEYWASVSCSDTGEVMLAGQKYGRLYVSADRGATWTETQPLGDIHARWWGVAVSGNGNVLYACELSEGIYKSTDGGTTWTNVSTQDYGYRLATDYDGTVVVLACYYGRLYLSTNSGTSWAETQPAGAVDKMWCALAVSRTNGSVILAGAYGGRLYLSTNTGTSWGEVQPAGAADKNWFCAGADADGSVLLAGVYGGRLYQSSNTGSSWAEIQPGGDTDGGWTGIACDSDASVIYVCLAGGVVAYNASGWPAITDTAYWSTLACTSDGSVALAAGGGPLIGPGPINIILDGYPYSAWVDPDANGGDGLAGLRPTFQFDTANGDAAALHVILQVSDNPTFASYDINSDSATDYANWEEAASPYITWTQVPAGGITAGNRIRYTPASDLSYGPIYGRVELRDSSHTGARAPFAATVTAEATEGLVVLIGGTTYYVGACRIAEETGGDASAIELEVLLSAYIADPWTKGDAVIVTTGMGGGRTWQGTVESWRFSGSMVQIHCLQQDAYLSRKVCTATQDERDIGENLAVAVDAYGAPLTGASIDQITGLNGTLTGGYKYLREHFSDALRQLPNYLYWVDETGDVHFIDQADLETAAFEIAEADPS